MYIRITLQLYASYNPTIIIVRLKRSTIRYITLYIPITYTYGKPNGNDFV